jgi:hypothetical protein
MTTYLRPDERASQSDIERSKRQDAQLKSNLSTAANVGLSAAGLGLSSKILPFLNKSIPTALAIKGINKISPKIGGLIKKGMEEGLDLNDGFEFLKGQIEKKHEPAKENRNIIEQYSPELFQFINDQVRGRGLDPIQAGALAQNDHKFTKIIKKISEDHKSPWSNILQTVFGNNQAQGQAQSNPNNEQVQQQGQNQPGAGEQRLLGAIQQLRQARGG